MKLSVFVLVKDNPEGLKKCMESIKGCFDEIVIVDTDSTDGGKTVAVAKEYTEKVFNYPRPKDFEWIDDFAAARNFAMSKCTGDYIVWIDSDDVAVGFKRLRHMIEETMESGKKVDCLFLRYDYAFDEYGNCITTQFRERVLRAGMYDWKSEVHEVAQPRRPHSAVKLSGDSPFIRHEGCIIGDSRDGARMARNMAIIERVEARDGKLEVRMQLYKGNTLYALGRHEEAAESFKEYIARSDYAEEAYVARVTMSCCYRDNGQYDEAIEVLSRAILESPDQPAAYTTLAELFMRNEDWDKAYHFAKMATEKESDTSHLAFNPMTKLAIPAAVLQISALHLQKFEEALEWGEKAASFMRGDAECVKLLEQTKTLIEDQELYKAYMRIRKVLEEEGNGKKLVDLTSATPSRISDIGELAQNMRKDRSLDTTTVAIYCGPAPEEWGPFSVHTGLGGSEEAAVNMAYELRDQGMNVEVYCTPPMNQQGDIDGVQWLPYWAYRDDDVDVFVAWRAHQFLENAHNAKCRLLWLHDKQHLPFREETLHLADRILALSEYHAEDPGFANVPPEKIYFTSNGLNPDFTSEAGNNEWNRVIFPSSPDRGLDKVLELWPKVLKEVPEAQLDIFYGFSKHYDIASKRDRSLVTLKQKILKLLDQPGVNFHGMVGHKELADAFAKAGVWAYPTQWPETSCITAMKAAASGCYVVTSGYGVLPETLEGIEDFGPTHKDKLIYGDKKREKAFVDAIVGRMVAARDYPDVTREYRIGQAKKTMEKYSWTKVAKEWSNLFSEMLDPVAVS